MTDEHRSQIPIDLEQVVAGLTELETVLGGPARARLPVIRAVLMRAMAARDRGDLPTALQAVAEAMQELSALGDTLGGDEGPAMRAVAEQFRRAVLHRSEPEARRTLSVMLEKSGAKEIDRSRR